MSVTRKKPWNRVSLPVYSVSSWGQKPNMHVCTYVSAVSMQPKRIMVALYNGTQTLENVSESGAMILQLLAPSQYNLVNLLGKQSGKTIDKTARLNKRKLLMNWQDQAVLKDALSCMYLKVLSTINGGDHMVFICEVTAWKNLNDGLPLTTNYLHEKKIIRV